MAKITDGTFRDWHDAETIDATEYKRERELLKVAINDNDARLGTVEQYTASIGLGNVQMQKITDDKGGVNLTALSVNDDILKIILAAGKGMRTFYAISGSKNLPPTNISIRGISHFTSDDIGWVYATDYRNNIFTNYYDTGSWKGWRGLNSTKFDAIGTPVSANSYTESGNYLISSTSPNLPPGISNSVGTLTVINADSNNNLYHQEFMDLMSGYKYQRTKYNGTWTAWKRLTSASDNQGSLWYDTGWYMIANQTVKPTKKLSQCRNGWVLCWCDYDPGLGAGSYDIVYSYIPKGTSFKNGNSHNFTITNYISATSISVTGKKLYVYDDKLVGHDDNAKDATQTNDVVLMEVLEW